MSTPRSTNEWRIVAILTIVYTYAFIDRQILALLVQPIKAHLDLTDTQMSLLLGVSFALFYSILNLPAGYLVDRFNRFKIIAIATLVWSGMTILCGLSQNFWQLSAARAGVGLAEAVVTPAAFSLIRDAVPAEKRGRAFSIFAMGPYFGNALSLLIGGALIAAARSGAFADTPGLAGLRDWQSVLVLVGLVGIPLAAILLFFREPPRPSAEPLASRTSYAITLRHMREQSAIYAPLIAYVSFGAILSFGTGAWLPAMLERKWGLPTAQIGVTLGLINLLFAPAGLFLTGLVMDRLTAAGRDIRMLGGAGAVLALAAYVAAPLAPTLTTTWICLSLGFLFKGTSYAIGAATLAEVTPSQLMGRVTAIYFLIQNIVGQVTGPTLVALLSDLFFEGRLAMAYALATVGTGMTICVLISVWLLARALRTQRHSVPLEG